MSRTKPAGGFSMIELMVTVAIVAVLAAVALPSFEGVLRSNRVATYTNQLVASLMLARSEATRNPNGAALCTSTNGTTCSGGWNDGWIVWIDLDGDGTPDAGERVVRYTQGDPKLALTATAAPAAGGALRVRFDARGRTVGAAQTYVIALQPYDCTTGDNLLRSLNVSATGQVRTTYGNCT